MHGYNTPFERAIDFRNCDLIKLLLNKDARVGERGDTRVFDHVLTWLAPDT